MTEQTEAEQTLVAALKDIAARENGAVLANRRRLVGLLRDKLPEQTRAIRMALTAYDAGVPARLRAYPSLADVEVAQESHRLSNETGLSDSFSRSAVEAWAQALTGYAPPEAVATPIVAPVLPAAETSPPQTSPGTPVEPEPVSASVASETSPTPPAKEQPLSDAPSLQPSSDAGSLPPPPVSPYAAAHPGSGSPVVTADKPRSRSASATSKAIKVATFVVLGIGILLVAGLATGVLGPQLNQTASDSSGRAAPVSSTPSPRASTARKRQTAADGTTLIGAGRYPAVQSRSDAGNILTFKFATENGGDTSYAAAIRYQGATGGTGAISAVRNGQSDSTGNVPLQRWVKSGEQNVILSGQLANNAGGITPVCVFATLSANTQVPEVTPGKSFCVYKVAPDGHCAISRRDAIGCAALK